MRSSGSRRMRPPRARGLLRSNDLGGGMTKAWTVLVGAGLVTAALVAQAQSDAPAGAHRARRSRWS